MSAEIIPIAPYLERRRTLAEAQAELATASLVYASVLALLPGLTWGALLAALR